MRKYIIILTLFFYTLNNLYAGYIYPTNRVSNQNIGIGLCWFACVDMIARENNIKELVGILDKAKKDSLSIYGANLPIIYLWLIKTKTLKMYTHIVNYNYKLLYEWLNKGYTPIIYIKGNDYPKYSHACILTETYFKNNDKFFIMIDPNNILVDIHVNEAWLKEKWIGTADLIMAN